MRELTFTVPPEYDGETLQAFLRRQCGLSWRMVVRLKRVERGMTVDGVPCRSIDRIAAGQTVVLTMPADTLRVEPMDLPLDVVYEDEHLLVVNKPPYLAVHPSAGLPDPTLANIVTAHCQRMGETVSFRPVNRLDRNTSGLLLAGKNSHVTYALGGKVQKTYLAILLGRLDAPGTVDAPIRVKEGCCITREVGEGGKPSVTHYQPLAWSDDITLVRLRLETGRTHQIRVHMASIGFPLAGDTMYGEDQTVMVRQGLHCDSMTFTHPVTGEQLSLTAPLPADMRACLAAHGIIVYNQNGIAP